MKAYSNGLQFTWLGHATWLIKTPGGKRVLIDPWLGNPRFPDAWRGRVEPVDVILITHGHDHHIADVVAVAKRTGAVVVGIHDLLAWLQTKGVENVASLNMGGSREVAGLTITMTNAVHSSSTVDGGRSVALGEPCGFVVTFENGYTLYNTGDTAVFGDMALIAELYHPDIVILPVGDNSTMGPREAAKAIELMRARRVLPNHFGTSAELTGTPEELRTLVDDQVEIIVLEPGDTLG